MKNSYLMDEIKKLVKKGNIARILIKKSDGEPILNLPLTVGAIGAAVGITVAPLAMIASVVATIGFDCSVELIKSSGEVIKLR